MSISLPGMNTVIKSWLNSRVRVDRWSLDTPSVLSTKSGALFYPANTAVQFPPTKVEFEKTAFGLYCRAEFHFRIVYRITSQISFDLLPISAACAIVNNLYYDAVINPAAIDESIVLLKTPPDGIDIQVSDPEEESKDWLVFLNPEFYVEFKAAKADDSVFNPPKPIDPVITLTGLDLGIYRTDLDFDIKIKRPTTFNLDRRYRLRRTPLPP